MSGSFLSPKEDRFRENGLTIFSIFYLWVILNIFSEKQILSHRMLILATGEGLAALSVLIASDSFFSRFTHTRNKGQVKKFH